MHTNLIQNKSALALIALCIKWWCLRQYLWS